MPLNIAIIGGGLTGLSAADELSAAGHAVTVYEEQSTTGGLAGSFEVNGARLERFYHHLFTSDTAMTLLKALWSNASGGGGGGSVNPMQPGTSGMTH